ncbi:hypothetical protein YH65_11080 [Sulfurovum lithotrophicum]|uniref:Uncharacterized protein n=1 Tax=Sulfurovum lithotrophicum TaxID=206403 RepID=A0A7U4M394_9BACT|nr:hypothetical protein [Sulfurovum lithotrophicum]AKF25864.1 hypothetical protein YH65_11080 [Sulfurovum lithotrophicum]
MKANQEITKEVLEDLKSKGMKNAKFIDYEGDRRICKIQTRGAERLLLDYDYYFLGALILTDHLDELSYEYINELSIAIRTDIRKMDDTLFDIIAEKEQLCKKILDRYIEITDEFSDFLGSDEYVTDSDRKRKLYMYEAELEDMKCQ